MPLYSLLHPSPSSLFVFKISSYVSLSISVYGISSSPCLKTKMRVKCSFLLQCFLRACGGSTASKHRLCRCLLNNKNWRVMVMEKLHSTLLSTFQALSFCPFLFLLFPMQGATLLTSSFFFLLTCFCEFYLLFFLTLFSPLKKHTRIYHFWR